MLLARGSRVTVWVAARQVCLPEATCHLPLLRRHPETENWKLWSRNQKPPEGTSHLPEADPQQESHLPPVPDFGQSYSRCSPWLRRHPETEIKTLVKKQQMN